MVSNAIGIAFILVGISGASYATEIWQGFLAGIVFTIGIALILGEWNTEK